MFGHQAIRLLRNVWTSTSDLAEELWSMFDDKLPLEHNGPLTIRKLNPNAPSLQILNTAGGDSLFVEGGTVTVKDVDHFTVTQVERIDIGELETVIYIKGKVYPPEASAAGTTVFLGKVISGTGNTYVVELYGKGSSQAATKTVTATVPQIADEEQIPPDTWIGAVHQFDNGIYEFQPPVWI